MGNSGKANRSKPTRPARNAAKNATWNLLQVHPMSFMAFPLLLPAPCASDMHGKSHKKERDASAWLHGKHGRFPPNPALFTPEVSVVMMSRADDGLLVCKHTQANHSQLPSPSAAEPPAEETRQNK